MLQPVTATAAVETQKTPDAHWQQAPALEISAYKNEAGRSNLEVVEVFNGGKTMIDVTKWRLMLCDAMCAYAVKSDSIVLGKDAPAGGQLEPSRHAIISIGEQLGVVGASYETSWGDIPNFSVVKSIRLVPDAITTSTASYAYKDYKSQVLSSPSLWRRTASSTPNYSGTPFYETKLVNDDSSVNLYDDGLYVPVSEIDDALEIVEIYPYARDCTPKERQVDASCRDFVKIYNSSDNTINLSDYAFRSDSSYDYRTDSNTYLFGESESILPHGYFLVNRNGADEGLNLTNDGGYVWLEPRWGGKAAAITQYASAGTTKQGFSWLHIGPSQWDWTTTPAVGGASEYTPITSVIADCPAGKYRSAETGRCRNLEDALSVVVACEEGQERNPLTNRCRKINSSLSSLAPCGEGQERNPLTNRCRSIANAVAELLPCDEGYERNPETNRCRKVSTTSIPSALYPVKPYAQSSQQTLISWIVGGAIGISVAGYSLWEWRKELLGIVRRLVTFVHR